MEPALESPRRKRLGRSIGIATAGVAAVLLLVVLQQTKKHPRTDDANVRGILYLPNSALFPNERYKLERIQVAALATVNREVALLQHLFNMAEKWGIYRGTQSGERGKVSLRE